MAELVRIADLRTPELNNQQRAALTTAAAHPVNLSSTVILAEAVKSTGLIDFGPGEFRERLDIWLADANADKDLTEFGRAAIYRICLRFAETRLRAHHMLKLHPDIEAETIVAPLIVIGLPRSGTTHMVNLLAADPRRRSLQYWEACEPVPQAGNAVTEAARDPRYVRSKASWEAMRGLLPLMELMHPFEAEHIHEDLELQGPDFSSYFPEWLFRAPRWRVHYESHDQTPHYEYLRTMLKMLQWINGPKRWVLKCPQHLEQIPALLKVFPDAQIVMMLRDPVASIQSAVTMSAYTGRLRYKHLNIDELFQFWSDRTEDLLRAGVRDAELIPASQRFDVAFQDLTADDLSVVSHLYETFAIEYPRNVQERIEKYSSGHRRGASGRVVYDVESDFGVDPNKLRERFGFYFNAYPAVRRET